MLRQVAHIARPVEPRAAPLLEPGLQLAALAQRADAQRNDLCRLVRRRVDRGSALRAESLHALRAALRRRLDVLLDRPAFRRESAFERRHVHAERRPGRVLAVRAMADPDLLRIDLGSERDVSAMTAAIYSHGSLRRGALFGLLHRGAVLEPRDAVRDLLQAIDGHRRRHGPALAVGGSRLEQGDRIFERPAVVGFLAHHDLTEPDALLADEALDLAIVGRTPLAEGVAARGDRHQD